LQGPDVWKFSLTFVLTKFMVIFWTRNLLLGYVMGISFTAEI